MKPIRLFLSTILVMFCLWLISSEDWPSHQYDNLSNINVLTIYITLVSIIQFLTSIPYDEIF